MTSISGTGRRIDRVHFAECFVPRSKTGAPQRLAIPDTLAPFLRAWWERGGKPDAGPVFPARGGKRAGGFKAPKGAYAIRLRRGLVAAGVFRVTPHEVVREVRKGRGTNMRTVRELAPDARDPLYFETASTLPVDFHSFRRAFNTGLAEAGVNVQHAMHLAAHADAKVHARYVMSTTAMRTIPAAALPALPLGPLTERAKAVRAGRGIVTARDVSTRAGVLTSEKPHDSGAGHGIRTRDIQLGKLALYQLS